MYKNKIKKLVFFLLFMSFHLFSIFFLYAFFLFSYLYFSGIAQGEQMTSREIIRLRELRISLFVHFFSFFFFFVKYYPLLIHRR